MTKLSPPQTLHSLSNILQNTSTTKYQSHFSLSFYSYTRVRLPQANKESVQTFPQLDTSLERFINQFSRALHQSVPRLRHPSKWLTMRTPHHQHLPQLPIVELPSHQARSSPSSSAVLLPTATAPLPTQVLLLLQLPMPRLSSVVVPLSLHLALQDPQPKRQLLPT